jgi:8-oxo-dGTP pyrophosphatase MutT (NUDIX family)
VSPAISQHHGLMCRTTALRELHEETGYGSGKAGEGNAEVEDVSPVLVKDPGWVTLSSFG